jgi:threonine/homoserine/homoserine lactone efflux protein
MNVPLSDEEQRLLEQMERALAADDPKFASTLRGSRLRSRNRRRAMLGVVGFVVGIAMLMTGVILVGSQGSGALTVVSVAGFVVMLASAYVALTYWRRASAPDEVVRPGSDKVTPMRTSSGRGSSGFMDRLEERWRRRRDSGL